MRVLPLTLRLVLALVLTLAAVLVTGQQLVSHATESAFVEEQAADYSADARTIERAAAEPGPGEDAVTEAQEIIEAVAARPGVSGVELVDEQGRVVASSDAAAIGQIEEGPAAKVARGGPAYAGAEGETLATALAAGRATNACFRIGGDEFAVVLPRTGLGGARAALEAAAGRLAAELPGVHLSIGLAIGSSAGGDSEVFRKQADVALYEAKLESGTAIVAFDEISSMTAMTHPDQVRALRKLIDDGDMDIAFQPIWDLDSSAIFGYEALARPAPEYGFDGPGEAFELAEKTGLAHLLCHTARRRALACAEELPPDALLFLNLSPKTLEHDLLAGDSFVEAIEAAGLAPSQVVLELTEHATTRLSDVVREIARLRELGFKISLDDVGAGNAGLELLSSISPDFVKIDRSIVHAALEDPSAHGVLEAVIAYARRTSAFVIAEGIETPAQLELVRDPFSVPVDPGTGVGGGQGFLLGRPVHGFVGQDLLVAAAL